MQSRVPPRNPVGAGSLRRAPFGNDMRNHSTTDDCPPRSRLRVKLEGQTAARHRLQIGARVHRPTMTMKLGSQPWRVWDWSGWILTGIRNAPRRS